MRVFLLFVLLLSASAPNLFAQSVVIYRCTDASGALTVQNAVPCPKGSKQEKRVIEAVQTIPTPPPAIVSRSPAPTPQSAPASNSASSAATADSATVSTIADADRLPPPALFECRTYDKDRYLSDDGNPPQRCAPLTTTGIDGSSSTGAGESCQMVSDQCQRIADGALCENWKARLLEAQATLRFGRHDNREAAQAEVDRIDRVVRESTCGR